MFQSSILHIIVPYVHTSNENLIDITSLVLLTSKWYEFTTSDVIMFRGCTQTVSVFSFHSSGDEILISPKPLKWGSSKEHSSSSLPSWKTAASLLCNSYPICKSHSNAHCACWENCFCSGRFPWSRKWKMATHFTVLISWIDSWKALTSEVRSAANSSGWVLRISSVNINYSCSMLRLFWNSPNACS